MTFPCIAKRRARGIPHVRRLFFVSDPENPFAAAFRIFQCLIGSAVIPPYHSNQAIRPVYHPAVAGGDRLFVVDARKLNGDQDFVKAAFVVFLIRV